MNTLTKRALRLVVATVALAGVFVAVNAVPGAATPPVSFSSQTLGRGNYTGEGSLALRHGLDIVTSKITVGPGGSSGWHSHPGGAIVIIQQGEMTIYESVRRGEDEGQSQADREGGARCLATRYTAGQAFIERVGEVVDAVNTGKIDTIIIATFPGVPVGGLSRIDQPNPGTCPV